jgi:hypothetical protein
MGAQGTGTDPSPHTNKQKLGLGKPAELSTVVRDVIPSLLNRPNFSSLHNLDCSLALLHIERLV